MITKIWQTQSSYVGGPSYIYDVGKCSYCTYLGSTHTGGEKVVLFMCISISTLHMPLWMYITLLIMVCLCVLQIQGPGRRVARDILSRATYFFLFSEL
jgi:hypothetical protein